MIERKNARYKKFQKRRNERKIQKTNLARKERLVTHHKFTESKHCNKIHFNNKYHHIFINLQIETSNQYHFIEYFQGNVFERVFLENSNQ